MADNYKRKKRFSYLSIAVYAYAIIVLGFLLIPTLMIIPISFGDERFLEFPPKKLSIRWYIDYITSHEWIRATMFSLRIAALTTIVSVVIGTMAALALVRGRVFGREWLNTLVLSPLIIPSIVTAVAMYSIYARLNLVGSTLGFVLAHTVLAVPYVILIVSTTLYRFEPNLELAAMNLGASRFQAIRKVTVPIIYPGIVSGGAFAFITSFDESIISFFISGVRGKTLPKKIFENVDFSVTPTVAVAGTLLTVTSLLIMSGIQLMQYKTGRKVKKDDTT